ncbi:hotdog fold thioesterase [Ectothiorhodospira variabilis]|uniref:hotdog fold thioesterase n=1 Tax=Ectothiorhodospira variabilis TaxID=505694 RepID=UPI001EFBD4C0|nr:hotdog fold thioesterase [Ectothiorhodospira variabilis]MCG5495793.1 hotdog fold thioesterase [Ectothiorhodospira variabilis]MCG5504773.1 hotdog fold thioesterase [Ectothiorhodospira variabilis]MCG5507930.1 hotdog fold thioesterase [Ectothiorhodospira variabilis]
MWKRPVDLDALNDITRDTLMQSLGIRITQITDDAIYGTLPVDERTRHPFGLLHGGASVALAETLGSVGAHLASAPGYMAVGLEINANHLRPARQGVVTGCARPVHVGSRTQVWEIRIRDDQDREICIARLTTMLTEAPASNRSA